MMGTLGTTNHKPTPFPRNGNRFRNLWGIMTQMISSKVGNCQSFSRTDGADFLLEKGGKHLWFSGLVRELLSPSLPSQWLNTLFFWGGGGAPFKKASISRCCWSRGFWFPFSTRYIAFFFLEQILGIWLCSPTLGAGVTFSYQPHIYHPRGHQQYWPKWNHMSPTSISLN